MSQIPKFGDTSESPAGDTASPARDVVASPNCGICDTAVSAKGLHDVHSLKNRIVIITTLYLTTFTTAIYMFLFLE